MALYSLLLINRMVSVTHQWSRQRPPPPPPRGEWPALTSVTHRDDAVEGVPCIYLNNRPLLNLLLAKFASSTSPQKPPATYTRVNDFGPHTDSIFRGATYTRQRLICEYIRYVIFAVLLKKLEFPNLIVLVYRPAYSLSDVKVFFPEWLFAFERKLVHGSVDTVIDWHA